MNGSCVEWCWECTSTFYACSDGNWMENRIFNGTLCGSTMIYDTLVRFNDRILISKRAWISYPLLCGLKGYGCKLHFSFVVNLSRTV